MTWTSVRSPCRLHFGLFDLANATQQRYGGIGVTLGLPTVVQVSVRVAARRTAQLTTELDARTSSELDAALARLGKQLGGMKFEARVDVLPPQHVGLGTKTALLLGALKAASICCGTRVPRETLQMLSGRGGTSGVGINAFFDGGFIVDGGRRPHPEEPFGPSSSVTAGDRELPVVICRAAAPRAWMAFLVVARGRRFSGARELSFFRANTPIENREALESIALAYHGVLPAVMRADLSALGDSMERMLRTGFKGREMETLPRITKKMIGELQALPRTACGLSSMGPLVFVIAGKTDQPALQPIIQEIAERHGAVILGEVPLSNKGYEVLS